MRRLVSRDADGKERWTGGGGTLCKYLRAAAGIDARYARHSARSFTLVLQHRVASRIAFGL